MKVKTIWTRQTRFGNSVTHVRVEAHRINEVELPTIVISNYTVGPRGGSYATGAIGFTQGEWAEIGTLVARESAAPPDEPEDQGRDEAYERAAARARGNDFKDTDGKDWT